jgi:uncharacterized protein
MSLDADSPDLDRLTICVSNACNMACRYCYAARGRYGARALVMSTDTAIATAAWALRSFRSIRHLHFFGGEPTLNMSPVRLLCEFFGFCTDRGRLSRSPSYGITTNGLHVNGDTLAILRRHGFSVTVSLDGPPEIHNALRRDHRRAPTHDAVLRTVDALVAQGITPEFECTYTAEHLRRGITVVDLLRYFATHFGSRVLHIPLVITRQESPWMLTPERAAPLYVDAVRESMESLAAGQPRVTSMVARWLRSLVRKRPIESFCPAGTTALTVQADGSIHTCFMLSRDRRALVGSVFALDATRDVRAAGRASVAAHDKWTSVECNRCWMQSLCFGCIGEDLARWNTLPARAADSGRAPMCDLRRSCAAAFFKALGSCDARALAAVGDGDHLDPA